MRNDGDALQPSPNGTYESSYALKRYIDFASHKGNRSFPKPDPKVETLLLSPECEIPEFADYSHNRQSDEFVQKVAVLSRDVMSTPPPDGSFDASSERFRQWALAHCECHEHLAYRRNRLFSVR